MKQRLASLGRHATVRHFNSTTKATGAAAPRAFFPLIRAAASLPPAQPEIAVDHLVIGAGAVGLAVARELVRRWPEKTTYLVERRVRFGEETSSRNSEVVHAGLYYPLDSLKTQMCIRGRDLLYKYCEASGVPYKQLTKLIVGPTSSRAYLEGIIEHASQLPARHRPQLKLLSGEEAREMEPDLSPDVGAAVHSLSTGIVSSHEYMASLEQELLEAECAEIVYDTSVLRVDPIEQGVATGKRGRSGEESGWVVHTKTGDGDVDTLRSRVVINSAGLNAPTLLNGLLRDGHFGAAPREWAREGSGEAGDAHSKPLAAYYSKGNYASYKGEGVKSVKRLIYPVPFGMEEGGDPHKHQGLGTHLTLDLDGGVRFGPDTEWLHPTEDSLPDFWESSLAPLAPVPASHSSADTEARLDAMHEAIRSYLPHVLREGLTPDYAGIRPKLIPPGAAFRDFGVLLHDSHNLHEQRIWQEAMSDAAPKGVGGGALISLAGIESPGLTSSLAIAELVGDLVGRRVWEEKGRRRKARKEEEYESASLDGWA